MKTVRKMIHLALCIFFVWSGLCVARPYLGRYWLEMQLRDIALFGTKNGVDDTMQLLVRKLKTEGRSLREDDFVIEKDEANNIQIHITYTDEINLFGTTLRHLTMDAKASAVEVKSF